MFFLLLNQGNFLLITLRVTDEKSQICNPLLNCWNSRRNFSVEQIEWWSHSFSSLGTANRKIYLFLTKHLTQQYLFIMYLQTGILVPACLLLSGTCVCEVGTGAGKQTRHLSLCLVGGGDGLTRSMVHYSFPVGATVTLYKIRAFIR